MFSSRVSDLVIVETGSSTLADAALNVSHLRSNEYSDVIEIGRFPHAWTDVRTALVGHHFRHRREVGHRP
jgi:hypothetical protein